jgi:hypothetical protein
MASGECPSMAKARSACLSSPITVAACSECPCTSPIATSTLSRQRQRLVKVAADLGLIAGRDIAVRHGQAGYLGQRRGQEAALQGQGDQVLLGVGAQGLDRERHRLHELAEDLLLLLAGYARAFDGDGDRRPARLDPGRRQADIAPQRAVRDQPQPVLARRPSRPRWPARAEHVPGHLVGQPGRPAALRRLGMLRGGRHPAHLAVGHLQDDDGLRGEDPRGPGGRARASPSKVSAALMSSVALVSAASRAAVRSARCRAREYRSAATTTASSSWVRSARSGRRRRPGSGPWARSETVTAVAETWITGIAAVRGSP